VKKRWQLSQKRAQAWKYPRLLANCKTRFQKYGKLENEILDAELRAKTARMLESEIHASALALVKALAGLRRRPSKP